MARNYKQVVALTKSMGSIGGQEKICNIRKLDPTLTTSYLNNVVVSGILNDYNSGITQSPPGFMVYLTTSTTWADDEIIAARAFNNGGNVSLTARRRIQSNLDDVDGTTGPIYVWVEVTDLAGVGETMEARFAIEVWGRFLEVTLDTT